MCCCGSGGSCGESPGSVKQELGKRDGGRGGATSRGGRVGFEVGGLRVRWDFNVGRLGLRLAWLRGGLGV